jgi:hypothetical protein
MLQLVSPDSFNQTNALAETLKYGCILLKLLTEEPDNSTDRMFAVTLNKDRDAFPLLCAELKAKTFERISKMTQAGKLGLKQKLKLDVEALIAKASHHVADLKWFNTEMLPSDPDDCSAKLRELKTLKIQQIKKLNLELEELDVWGSLTPCHIPATPRSHTLPRGRSDYHGVYDAINQPVCTACRRASLRGQRC